MNLLQQLPQDVLVQGLKNGAVLMVLGMAIVFLFLTILIFTTKAVSLIVGKFESKKPAPEAKKAVAANQTAASNDAEVAVAIAVAMAKSKS
ncbi:MAG: OadG family protein [Sphaerochaetaceae bacterium]|nr:OadG family protein [Sphaerochaetaceae bacterium]